MYLFGPRICIGCIYYLAWPIYGFVHCDMLRYDKYKTKPRCPAIVDLLHSPGIHHMISNARVSNINETTEEEINNVQKMEKVIIGQNGERVSERQTGDK